MTGLIRRFAALSTEEKKLFLEAYSTLGVMRLAILTISFKKLTQDLRHTPAVPAMTSPSEGELHTARTIGRVITQAAAHTPWESACLAQSLVAQRMLRKRGIPGLLCLGVAKDEANLEKIKAHAWSQCGGVIVTGEAGCEAFRVISVFEWEKIS